MGSELTKTVKRTSNVPTKDSDIGTLGQNTVVNWKLNPAMTLLWITVAAHEANVNDFNSTLGERASTGGGRREISGKLALLDDDIDEGVKAIKGYLVYKYEKDNAPIYYPQFGIVREGKNFVIPRDHDKRSAALALTVAAITTHGFDAEKYGLDFWQTTKDNYAALMTSASATDGTVSQKVGTKNELRKTIVKTHNALINVLRGNYPDNYKSVIREWGFQKEKY
jgi:hypothetical protein